MVINFQITKAKILIRSKGRCDNFHSVVSDIYNYDSPLKRWYPTPSYNKTLEGSQPLLAQFYSIKNEIPANEISAKSSDFPTTWNCPFCMGEYVSTNYKQIENDCKCKLCDKKALDYIKQKGNFLGEP